MKLKAELPIKGDRIDYSFETETNEHTVVFAMSGERHIGKKGAIASVLAPYRGYRWVSELFTWLTM